MNLVLLRLEDLAVLDRHFDNRLRRCFYELVGAHLEPCIDVAREKDQGRARWFLVVRGLDGQGKTIREERFEVALEARFERVIGIATQIHVRSYLQDLREELAGIYGEGSTPEVDDDVDAPWFSPRRGPAS